MALVEHSPGNRLFTFYEPGGKEVRGRLWNESPRVHSSLVFTTSVGCNPSDSVGPIRCGWMRSAFASGIAFIGGACSSESRPHANTAFSGERWQHSPTKNCSAADGGAAGGGAAHGKCLRKNKGWQFVFYRPGSRDQGWGSMPLPWPIQGRNGEIVPILPRRKQKVAARWGGMRNAQERQNVEPCVYGRI